MGVVYVIRARLPCEYLAPVLLSRSREVRAVPLHALCEVRIEEVNLLGSGRLHVRVLAKEMVKEGGPTLLGSDDKEVWQSPTGCGRYLSAARRRLVHGRKLHLKAGDFPVLLSEELALFLNLLQGRPE